MLFRLIAIEVMVLSKHFSTTILINSRMMDDGFSAYIVTPII